MDISNIDAETAATQHDATYRDPSRTHNFDWGDPEGEMPDFNLLELGPDEQESPRRKQLGCTGIPDVDVHLEPVCRDGGVVLVSGITGSGKTCLAGQIATRFASESMKVAYLSAEVVEGELLARTMSCMVEWPYSELKDGRLCTDTLGGSDFLMPVIRPENDEFTAKALEPFLRLHEHICFRMLDKFKTEPLTALGDVLDEVGEEVDCIILDALQLDGLPNGERVDLTEIATEVMEFLSGYAYEYKIPIFVFCQRNHTGESQDKREVKAGRAGGISEFPGIEKLADATIELTQPVSRPTDRLEGEGAYSSRRHMIVAVKGQGRIPWIPVLADFDYQRFIARGDEGDAVGEDMDSDKAFRRHVLRNSERDGFIKFPRDRWDDLIATKHQGTVLVYLAMVLNANPRTGRESWSQEGLAELLGIHRSVVRCALKKLHKMQWIKPIGKPVKNHRRTWEVTRYLDLFQKPEAHGFVVLAKSLLDVRRAELRNDQPAFAIWLRLLFEARFTSDIEGYFDRGQWPVNYLGLATQLNLSLEVVMGAFMRLEAQGRIKRWTDPGWRDEIVMLSNFDRYQRMVPWVSKD